MKSESEPHSDSAGERAALTVGGVMETPDPLTCLRVALRGMGGNAKCIRIHRRQPSSVADDRRANREDPAAGGPDYERSHMSAGDGFGVCFSFCLMMGVGLTVRRAELFFSCKLQRREDFMEQLEIAKLTDFWLKSFG